VAGIFLLVVQLTSQKGILVNGCVRMVLIMILRSSPSATQSRGYADQPRYAEPSPQDQAVSPPPPISTWARAASSRLELSGAVCM